jgi:hypothetical protein
MAAEECQGKGRAKPPLSHLPVNHRVQPVDYSHSIHRAELDRGCVWVLTQEGSLDALRTVPRAMRVEHLEAKCSGCRGGE